ncbi:hypothetical protein GUITHDRAFT_111387 [Guillardia theta CCMP2712]|uniref:Uncharacterized protein n=1 Tax=Guillardia theta (strain CCMP2712) TaxID=905079 RepID=L1J2G1_GUITC|nr:hypothetical protein GUITHDRAFT_111387 [Guillardia theta CCMP2712]EKX42716.1 hypothetical protein GUITHDRAFT_111387 [Guillardia theta CCMP2712]|eukprot:XP_005829696.1 hypothetical protein GUITHDRAFT_111387 [Guillardia theta CCMP2712]
MKASEEGRRRWRKMLEESSRSLDSLHDRTRKIWTIVGVGVLYLLFKLSRSSGRSEFVGRIVLIGTIILVFNLSKKTSSGKGKPLASSLIQEMQDSAKKITQELRDSSPAAKPWLAATSNQQTIECLERKEQLLDAKMEDMRRLLRIDAQQIVSFRDDFTSKREQERQSSSTDTA